MKQIPLTQGMFALVDDEDFEYLNQWKWHVQSTTSGKWYVVKTNPKTYIHQLILGAIKGQKIDHKDGNGLNNQRYNLRFCTQQQNTFNKSRQSNNKSGYKGVRFNSGHFRKKPWQATIIINRKQKSLGYYFTAIEAALAYDQAAKQYFGEFAKTNF